MAYLTYGENQVDQAELMNSLASGVEPYLNSTKWGQKKKYREKWLNAYQDIMNRGLVGASNENGMWKINHNGEAIDLDSKSNIDREMYQDAAYFIQSKMDSLQKKKEEEEKKETTNLPVYDNDQFTTGLNTQISNSLFGGRKFSTEEDWNILDERDENGIRGTNVRANKLADMLQSYSDSLEEGKYSFEGSPFKNLSDLKGRISTAIQSLRDGTWDQNDVDSLNSIGLNWRNYFYNGENDIAEQDAEGNQYTYAQLAERNRLAQEQKDKEDAAKLLKEQNANRGVLNKLGGIHAVEAANKAEDYRNWLADTYKVGQKGFDNINNRIQSLLEQGYTKGLSNADKKELGNLLYYVRSNNPNYQGLGNGQKTNLSDQDWKELQTHKNLSSQNINDYVRLPWQTDGRYIYADNQGNIYYMKPSNKQKIEGPKFVRSQAYNNYKNNFLLNTNAGSKVAQEQYLNQEGAENAEIGAIVADIASIIDPEPFSAMGLSLGAAGARNYAKLQQPGKWSLMDYGSQAIDYLTSVIGAIPVLGDAVIAGKVIKGLRRLGRFGAWSDIVQSTDGLKDIWDKKIMGDEKMTKQDWRIIGTAIRGLVSHGRLNQSNLAARKVMQERGIETGNSWGQRYGFTSSAKQTNKTDVLKVTKNGETTEVPIAPKQKQDLKEAFKKVKPSERTAEAKRILGEKAIPEGAEVKVSNGIRSTVRNWNRFTRRTSDSFGTRSEAINRTPTKSDEEFENFLQNRSTWNKIALGTNRYLRRIDRQLVKPSSNQQLVQENNPSEQNVSNTPTNSGNPYQGARPVYESKNYSPKAVKRDYKNIIEHQQFTNNKTTAGEYRILDDNIRVTESSGKYAVHLNGKKIGSNLEQKRVKEIIAEIVKNNKISASKVNSKAYRMSTKDIGKYLKDLKKKGWLKQGGQINNLDITIRNFIYNQ